MIRRRSSKMLQVTRKNNEAMKSVSDCIDPSSLWDITKVFVNMLEHPISSPCMADIDGIIPLPQPKVTTMKAISNEIPMNARFKFFIS